jgi:DNA-binding NarL/FixJ family response regulator
MPTNRELSVSIVEDDRATREGLALLIEGTPGFRVLEKHGSMEDAIVGIPKAPPDVLLCDIELPGMSGIDGVRRLKSLAPSVQILMLTVFADNDHVFEAICAGASGYLLKGTPPARLLAAIRELQGGGAPMSPEIARKVVTLLGRVAPPPREEHRLSAREVEILKLLSDGHSYKTAASELEISIDTVRFHIRNIYEKLHVHSKSEAVIRALRTGIVR